MTLKVGTKMSKTIAILRHAISADNELGKSGVLDSDEQMVLTTMYFNSIKHYLTLNDIIEILTEIQNPKLKEMMSSVFTVKPIQENNSRC